MNIYISILRGINVSGKNLVKMEALKELYSKLGFQNVLTYVQSGNVIFSDTAVDTKELEQKISRQINKDFGFEVPVIVLPLSKWKDVIDGNSFLSDSTKDKSFLHVTFLCSKPQDFNRKIIEDKKQPGEEIFFSDNAVYLYCPNGYGKTKLTNNFLETKLNVGATTRNWKTTSKLLELAQQIN